MIKGQRLLRRNGIQSNLIAGRLFGRGTAAPQVLSRDRAKYLLRSLDIDIPNTSSVSGDTASDALDSLNAAIASVEQFGWTRVLFGSSSSVFGGTYYASTTTYVLGAKQRLEVEADIHGATSSGTNLIVSTDATKGYNIAQQGDGNQVVYYQNGGSQSVLGSASGANSNNAWDGVHDIRAYFNVHASSNNRLVFRVENWPFNGNNAYLDTQVQLVGTAVIYLGTDDITKCLVRARILG